MKEREELGNYQLICILVNTKLKKKPLKQVEQTISEHSENHIMIKRTSDLTDLEGMGDRVCAVEEDEVSVV